MNNLTHISSKINPHFQALKKLHESAAIIKTPDIEDAKLIPAPNFGIRAVMRMISYFQDGGKGFCHWNQTKRGINLNGFGHRSLCARQIKRHDKFLRDHGLIYQKRPTGHQWMHLKEYSRSSYNTILTPLGRIYCTLHGIKNPLKKQIENKNVTSQQREWLCSSRTIDIPSITKKKNILTAYLEYNKVTYFYDGNWRGKITENKKKQREAQRAISNKPTHASHHPWDGSCLDRYEKEKASPAFAMSALAEMREMLKPIKKIVN